MFVGLTVQAFDDATEDKIVGVIVIEFRARFIRELAAAAPLYERIGSDRLLILLDAVGERFLVTGDRVVLRQTRSVIEELMDRDFIAAFAAEIRQILSDRAVQVEFPFVA